MRVGRLWRRVGSWISIIEQATNIRMLKKGIGVYQLDTEKNP